MLLESCARDAGLTPRGAKAMRTMLRGALTARLCSEAAWQANPGYAQVPIDRPIFVTGLPRTGTTALHRLLAADPAHQGLAMWLAEVPQPRPPRETWAANPTFGYIQAACERHHAEHPEFMAVHYVAADQVEECWQLLRQSMRSISWECLAHLPGYSAWLAAQDWTQAYRRHRRNLQLIGLPEAGRRSSWSCGRPRSSGSWRCGPGMTRTGSSTCPTTTSTHSGGPARSGRRADVVQLAGELFAQKGYRATTVRGQEQSVFRADLDARLTTTSPARRRDQVQFDDPGVEPRRRGSGLGRRGAARVADHHVHAAEQVHPGRDQLPDLFGVPDISAGERGGPAVRGRGRTRDPLRRGSRPWSTPAGPSPRSNCSPSAPCSRWCPSCGRR